MKFILILTLGVLAIAGVCARSSEENSIEPQTPKWIIRKSLERELKHFLWGSIDEVCPGPFSPEQIVFGTQKIVEFNRCSNTTIEIFINKLDDNIKLEDIRNFKSAVRLFSGAACEIFDDILKCLGVFSSVADLCYSERATIFKNKVFDIMPLIKETVCLRNGAVVAEIAEVDENFVCLQRTINYLANMELLDLTESDSKQLFSDENVCRNFNDVLQRVYVKAGECSTDVLVKVQEMLGVFCEGTQCQRFVHDLKCN